MVAYSFKQQFAAPILSGAKRQTIRAPRQGRAGHAKPGDALQLYTAMRTKQCRLIARATCLGTTLIFLDLPHNVVHVGGAVYQGWKALDTFARQDGFDSWLSMTAFWRDNHGASDWSGILIRWAGLAIP